MLCLFLYSNQTIGKALLGYQVLRANGWPDATSRPAALPSTGGSLWPQLRLLAILSASGQPTMLRRFDARIRWRSCLRFFAPYDGMRLRYNQCSYLILGCFTV